MIETLLPLAIVWLAAKRSGSGTPATPARPSPPQPAPPAHREASRRAVAEAQRVVAAQESSTEAHRAALALATYLEHGGASQIQVLDFQRRMGMAAQYLTGRVGRYTRERARELDVAIPAADRIPAPVRAATQ